MPMMQITSLDGPTEPDLHSKPPCSSRTKNRRRRPTAVTRYTVSPNGVVQLAVPPTSGLQQYNTSAVTRGLVEHIYSVQHILHLIDDSSSMSSGSADSACAGTDEAAPKPPVRLRRLKHLKYEAESNRSTTTRESFDQIEIESSASSSMSSSRLAQTKRPMRRSRSQPNHAAILQVTRHEAHIQPVSSTTNSSWSSEQPEDSDSVRLPPLHNGHNCSYRASVHSTSSIATSSSFASSDHTAINDVTIVYLFPPDSQPLTVRVTRAYTATQPDELSLIVGQTVHVTDCTSDHVWFGTCGDRAGWLPVQHVQVHYENGKPRQRAEDSEGSIRYSAATLEGSRDSGHSSTEETDPNTDLVMDTRRAKIVQEILHTERDYLALIETLVRGFLHPARQRPDLFPAEMVSKIFGNLESLCELHHRFITDLENEFIKDNPSATCVGHCFLRHENSFEIYSNYCNNRPLSCAELVSLQGIMQYEKFFQCCRLLFELPALPLEGFLLTPVQRICRYPLQLCELSKVTPPNHPDHKAILQAVQAMTRVANVINDRKRRLESLQKIALWQSSIAAWKGADLLDSSDRLVHFGDVTCRRFNSTGHLQWTKELCAFLFDHCLVLCRKDLLKRTQLVYKDRLDMNNTTFTDLVDGKDAWLGVSVKHAIQLCVTEQGAVQDVFVLQTRNSKCKQHWLGAFTQEQQFRLQPTDQPPGQEEKRIALAALHVTDHNQSLPASTRSSSSKKHARPNSSLRLTKL